MNNWQQRLDRYLTTPPDDSDFEDFAERVTEYYADYVSDIFIGSDLETAWLNKLYVRMIYTDWDGVSHGDLTTTQIANIINRAYKRYCND